MINNRGGRRQAASGAVPAHEAVQLISSGDRVFVHGGSAVPGSLLSALLDRSSELRDVEPAHLHLNGAVAMASAAAAPNIRHRALFVDATTRDAVATGTATYVPVFLSDVPRLFSSGRLPLDAALLHVSPPDAHGFCSLGVSVDCTLAAARAARMRIAQVNPRMPRTHGDSFIHLDEFEAIVEVDEPLSEAPPAAVSAGHRDVGRNVAELVEDGATLQLGIGAIPNAVLAALGDRRELGIHSEAVSDGVLDLVSAGVIPATARRSTEASSWLPSSSPRHTFVKSYRRRRSALGCSRAPDAATSLPATAATVTAVRSFGPRGSGGLPLSGRGGRGDHDVVGPHPGGTR